MTASFFAPPKGLCTKCTTRQATVWYSVDATAGVRGYASPRCEVCVLEEEIVLAKASAAELPKLEAKLAELLAAERAERVDTKRALNICGACLAARPKQEVKSIAYLLPAHCDDCGRLVEERIEGANTYQLYRIYDEPKSR